MLDFQEYVIEAGPHINSGELIDHAKLLSMIFFFFFAHSFSFSLIDFFSFSTLLSHRLGLANKYLTFITSSHLPFIHAFDISASKKEGSRAQLELAHLFLILKDLFFRLEWTMPKLFNNSFQIFGFFFRNFQIFLWSLSHHMPLEIVTALGNRFLPLLLLQLWRTIFYNAK